LLVSQADRQICARTDLVEHDRAVSRDGAEDAVAERPKPSEEVVEPDLREAKRVTRHESVDRALRDYWEPPSNARSRFVHACHVEVRIDCVEETSPKRARIIGVGSPLGDDAAGLEVARRLAAAAPENVDVIASDRPGAGLVDLLEGAEEVLIVDAVRSGAPAGTLHELSLEDVAANGIRLASSHAFGVAEALALARELGRLPPRVRVLGIETSPEAGLPNEFGATVGGAIDRATVRAREWAARVRR
jgi:hydrogenase maturation protease